MDTMLLTHLLNEEVITGYGLDSLGKLYLKLGKVKSKEFNFALDAWGWSQMPAETMAEYAMFDAYITYKLFQFIQPQLQQKA